MASAKDQADLFPIETVISDVIILNDRCMVRMEGDQRLVLVGGVIVAHFTVGDRMGQAYAMVSLVERGWADQNDVARVFGVTARTLRRYQRRFGEGGLAALGRGPGYPASRPRGQSRDQEIGKLKATGLSNRTIAHRLGIDEKSVRNGLRRLGYKPTVAQQVPLALPVAPQAGADLNMSASSCCPPMSSPAELPSAAPTVSASGMAPTQTQVEPTQSAFPASPEEPEVASPSMDLDPARRVVDRFFARMGLLDDAAPLFRAGTQVPGAGVLLTVPSLVHSGVFSLARQIYGSIGPAFYGLRTTILTMLLMALLRIKRPEALKEHSPPDLGRLLGLDRAPEVKTLRRQLIRLAQLQGAQRLGYLLAQRRVALRGEAMSFLYIDGHVRVYHGKRKLPKTHAARMRLSMPATTDYWVNDRDGDPLLVVTAEANAGLVKMLPPILDDVRSLLGQRRVTIVFDRGGWSPKLFQRLIALGFDILTYRKGRSRPVPLRCFHEHRGAFDGRKVRYQLDDRNILLLGRKLRLRLRQVTRLKDGHQTQIVTSRRDLTAIEVAYRMFERWRQENFFKYLREEFLLDALVDYQIEPDDPTREVPNPAWAAADAKLREVRTEITRLQQSYGAAALSNPERERPTMRGFKIAHGTLGKSIRALVARALKLEHQRALLPARIPVAQRTEGPVIKLATERKHLTDLVKMVAYQAESDLFRALGPHYKRHADEGRTLVQTALASAADIEVTDTELRITLAPLSSPHRSRAIAALCTELNETATRFPGTRLRLRYAVAKPG